MTIIARKPASKAKPAKTPAKKPSAKKTVAKKLAPKVAAKPAAKKRAPVKKAAVKKPVATKAKASAAPKAAAKAAKTKGPSEQLLDLITRTLDDGKAEDIVAIDMAGKSAIADYMVIASGRSQRQLGALAENLRARLKATGKRVPHPEGIAQGDWVLLDAGDVVVHLFRPEVRVAYNLEKMWSQPFAESASGMEGLIKERQAQHNARRADAPKGPRKPDFRKHGGKRPQRF